VTKADAAARNKLRNVSKLVVVAAVPAAVLNHSQAAEADAAAVAAVGAAAVRVATTESPAATIQPPNRVGKANKSNSFKLQPKNALSPHHVMTRKGKSMSIARVVVGRSNSQSPSGNPNFSLLPPTHISSSRNLCKCLRM
jgi:hypothetical protein